MARGRKRRNEDAADAAREHLNGADDDGPSELVNSAARAETICEAHEIISEYERQIKGLKAEIKAVLETRIVAGLGMKKGHFAEARKLLEMDQEDRDSLQDTIRECFAALGVGMQLNWLDVAGDDANA